MRRSDDELGNPKSDEFECDYPIDERVKEKFKQLEKKHDEDINNLKQLLMALLPPDRKQMVQEHFDEKQKYALAVHSPQKDNISSDNDKKDIQDTLNEDKVNTYTFCVL